LLAFSRKQVTQPTLLDLNLIVGNLANMLRRLIGENVELATHAGHPLDRIVADPGQIEQVIVNLAVNARDAMPKGGHLTVETRNVEIADPASRGFQGIAAGRYVELLVRDDGVGMDETTLAHLFEPFFTTKERGRGTGLGLASVHGIVTASNGAIAVESALGRGSTFRLVFPSAGDAALVRAPRLPFEEPEVRGEGTVLLVEDEAAVRKLVRSILVQHGFDVIEAADAQEAIARFDADPARIDLLLTDVIMPGLNGKELAERLRAERPSLRVLLMSGYTDDAIDRNGIQAAGFAFIQKPYTIGQLVEKLRELFGARRAE
jgi:CheY-like chemotaxis protein